MTPTPPASEAATALPSANEIALAIAVVSDSRASHASWLKWYEKHPEDEPNRVDVGDAQHHRNCIAGYDAVLDVLKRCARIAQPPAPPQPVSEPGPKHERKPLMQATWTGSFGADFPWIQQQDANGCVAACIAMICGKTYAEVKAELGSRGLHNDGMPNSLCDLLLAYAGFSVQRVYGREGLEWPPKPWAPLHLVAVKAASEHLVLMLADGKVVDPAAPSRWTIDEYLPGGEAGYQGVSWVAGVYPANVPGRPLSRGVPDTQVHIVTDPSPAPPPPESVAGAEQPTPGRAVISQLRAEAWAACQPPSTLEGEFVERLVTLIDEHVAAARAQAQQERGWISVKDRLPQDNELVIVAGGVARWNALRGEWISETGSYASGKRIAWKVTHWMPLSAPPSEAATEGSQP